MWVRKGSLKAMKTRYAMWKEEKARKKKNERKKKTRRQINDEKRRGRIRERGEHHDGEPQGEMESLFIIPCGSRDGSDPPEEVGRLSPTRRWDANLEKGRNKNILNEEMTKLTGVTLPFQTEAENMR